MLWLAAAFGLAVWEARRRRAGKAKTGSADLPQCYSSHRWGLLSFNERAASSSILPNGSGRLVAELKQELITLTAEDASVYHEHLVKALCKGEKALPDLCKLLKGSSDTEVLADVTEVLALLSPSRRGLQSAIIDAGAIPLLLGLLASAIDLVPTLDGVRQSACREVHGDTAPDQMRSDDLITSGGLHRDQRAASATTLNDQQRGRRLNGSYSTGSSTGSSSSSRGGSAGGGAPDPVVLSYVLRTLVNLTSNARGGSPVRQAILRDDAALETLLGLLHVPEEEEGEEEEGEEEDDAAWHHSSGGANVPIRAGSRSECDAAVAAAAAAGADVAPWHLRGLSPAARWLLAGLAAWLVAHLCSMPAGQLQLVQEGIIQKLVRLVRHGRMAWMAAATERAASRPGRHEVVVSGAADSEHYTGRIDRTTAAVVRRVKPGETLSSQAAGDDLGAVGAGVRRHAPCRGGIAGGAGGAGGGGSSSDGGGAGLMPHASSTMLYDAAAAAAAAADGDSSPRAFAMPYMIAAVQYGMMALVNITFDNSMNQRSVTVAGTLAELDALFGMLLQPGVLLPRSSAAERPAPTSGGWSPGLGEGLSAEQLDGGPHCEGGEEVGIQVGTDSGMGALLRSGYLGVAKFAVWLLAHLSSSDPDLKAEVAGPAFSFVTRLLDFLMLPDVDMSYQLAQPLALTEQAGLRCTSPLHATAAAPAAPTAAAAAAADDISHDVKASVAYCDSAGSGDGDSSGMSTSSAAASPAVIVVRQYAAMALVNLTCGVPSTKAVVARAMDWDGMAALLRWLADQTSRSVAATAEAAAASGGDPLPRLQPAGAGGPSAPISDLLLYTVWLLQHLSLSPYAAAAADAGIIPPLVAVLDTPDAHVRLRASAAIGALCSAPLPGATASGGSATASRQQQQLQPHRASFLAADGVHRLLAMAGRERDPHLLAYALLCLSSGVGDGNLIAVAEAVAGGALALLDRLLASEYSGCLLPAAEVLQSLARAALIGLRRYRAQAHTFGAARASTSDTGDAAAAAAAAAESAAAAAVEAAADYVSTGLLSRVVAVMLTHADPRVRSAMNEALGALTALPGVRERYCSVFAETLRDLVSSAEVELQVIPVN